MHKLGNYYEAIFSEDIDFICVFIYYHMCVLGDIYGLRRCGVQFQWGGFGDIYGFQSGGLGAILDGSMTIFAVVSDGFQCRWAEAVCMWAYFKFGHYF